MEPPAYLEWKFRNWLFIRAYVKAGSLAGIANHFHYVATRGKNGAIRDMWLGKKAIPAAHVAEIAELADIEINELMMHLVPKSANLQQLDWLGLMAQSKRLSQSSFSRFSREISKFVIISDPSGEG